MVKVLPAVQLVALLELKFIVWIPVPKSIVELSESVNVPIVSENPDVMPVLNVPPFKIIFDAFGMTPVAPNCKVPPVILEAPE
ncbi:hypothetical protein D3C72_264780 [compost metagenome]